MAQVLVEESALNKLRDLVQQLTDSFDVLKRETEVMQQMCKKLEQERDAYKDMLRALQATMGDKE